MRTDKGELSSGVSYKGERNQCRVQKGGWLGKDIKQSREAVTGEVVGGFRGCVKDFGLCSVGNQKLSKVRFCFKNHLDLCFKSIVMPKIFR